ncbi:unnamed protein product [Echinostoma caproni]|uniref:Uncharacterized protein n=1 Tax=Echinostoma caproni TaxID=27848 RepID=A0A183A720_9TREM|nr:unnamed protein product [Echinostoma caproni]
MSSTDSPVSATASENVIRQQSEENLNHQLNTHTEFRGTGSLMDLDSCTRSLADNSFVLEPSAFTLPNNPCRLFLPNPEGTHSLPLPRGNAASKISTQSASATNEKSDERLRKTHSSISLTSIPDGPYNDIWAGSIT